MIKIFYKSLKLTYLSNNYYIYGRKNKNNAEREFYKK